MMLTPNMILELNALKDADGCIDTTDVVTKAKDKKSALHAHPAFIWDVNQAAEAQWLDAARSVIQVWVTLEDRGDGEETEMRAMVSLRDDEGKRHYYTTPKILREDRTRLINSVLDQIASLIGKYPLIEFDPLIELITKIRATAVKPSRRKRKGVLQETRPRA